VGGLSHSNLMPDDQLRISNTRASGYSQSQGTTGDPPTIAPVNDEGQANQHGVQDGAKPAEEGEVCFICASTIEHLSIAPCNHQTCHICALRLRALYKKRDCAYCKVRIIRGTLFDFILTNID
jgi:Zinc finger, C3HC4 type (RING finger)